MGNPQRSAFTGERQETVRVGMGPTRYYHGARSPSNIQSGPCESSAEQRKERGKSLSGELFGSGALHCARLDLYTNEILVLPFRR